MTPEAAARTELSAAMISQVLAKGGVPEIIIGAKAGDGELYALDYFIVSPLKREQIIYVLSRVAGLLDGSIQSNN